MLLKENFNEEHIRELQKNSRRDPVLLERAVYAFGLLEALARVGMPFVFKGGTCLMLLMDKPRRLSTDIDIIVEPETDLDDYLEKASVIFPFRKVEEQKRIGKNNIEKRHFKFTYDSPINNKQFYILLDVLFEVNHYAEVVEKEIQNDLLLTEEEYLVVRIPGADCILADKLTAFAPHTTGIELNKGKDMEVMKQFYDVCSLIEIFKECAIVKRTYEPIALAEISYRGIKVTPTDCLWDTFEAALCIASRGKVGADEYPIYVKGIRDLRGHIYAENYSPEIAAGRATIVMYLIMCLLTDAEFAKVEDFREYVNQKLKNEKLLPLRYLKKANPEAYAYVVKTDMIMK
ncbi:MAG: nucleotidyl transferase AbiEii/AbiGii toxin family protein [Butyribacter sp.]|nr:nucleotidyl transferase AbiEii/AbiGii toxin family protein [bacterium]MDY3854993.1 nucleotidyl transferase AbiEii/AbiGii toxin family protein [Butyribacter sp.]